MLFNWQVARRWSPLKQPLAGIQASRKRCSPFRRPPEGGRLQLPSNLIASAQHVCCSSGKSQNIAHGWSGRPLVFQAANIAHRFGGRLQLSTNLIVRARPKHCSPFELPLADNRASRTKATPKRSQAELRPSSSQAKPMLSQAKPNSSHTQSKPTPSQATS